MTLPSLGVLFQKTPPQKTMISLLARMFDKGHVRLILTGVWGVLIFLVAAASRPETTIEILQIGLHSSRNPFKPLKRSYSTLCSLFFSFLHSLVIHYFLFSIHFFFLNYFPTCFACVSSLCCLQVSSKNRIFCFVWQINTFWWPAFPGKILKPPFFSFSVNDTAQHL